MLLVHQPARLINVDIRRGFIKRTVFDIFGGMLRVNVLCSLHFMLF